MRKFITALTLMIVSMSSYAVYIDDIVIGIDFSTSPATEKYPCQALKSCDDTVILEEGCQKTLKIKYNAKDKNGTLSCVGLNRKEVVFGTYSYNFYHDGIGGYSMNYLRSVELETIKTPNGVRYKVIVY